MTVSKGRIQVKSILVNLYPTNKNLIFKFIDDVISILPNLRGFVGIDFIEYKGEFFSYRSKSKIYNIHVNVTEV